MRILCGRKGRSNNGGQFTNPSSLLIPKAYVFSLFLSLLQLLSTRAKTLSVLEKLQQVSQVALSREPLYWLVYNALLLTYTLSRTMMKYVSMLINVLCIVGIIIELINSIVGMSQTHPFIKCIMKSLQRFAQQLSSSVLRWVVALKCL